MHIDIVLKHFFIILIFLYSVNSSIKAEPRLEKSVSPLTLDEDGRPIIKVTLHTLAKPNLARTFRFILDTGSTYTFLDTSIPSAFFWEDGAACQTQDATGTATKLPLVAIKRMEVGGMIRDGIHATRMDLKGCSIGCFQDEPVDGVLGMSFLQGTRFVLDLARKRVEWWAMPWPGGVTLPLIFRAGKVPVVTLSLNGKEGECLLDTGMGCGVALPRHLRPEGKGQPVLTQGFTGLNQTGYTLEATEVVAGTSAWKNIDVSFLDPGGMIGLEVWSAGPACFDFVMDRVTLTAHEGTGLAIERKPRLDLPLSWDRTGRAPRLSIAFVLAGSGLERSGLLPKDEIVQVGTLTGRHLTRSAIQDLFAKGHPQRWLVLRQGRQVELMFPQP